MKREEIVAQELYTDGKGSSCTLLFVDKVVGDQVRCMDIRNQKMISFTVDEFIEKFEKKQPIVT